jgi:hypothetical protein
MIKKTNLLLQFYTFITEQKILLFIFCLPIFVLALTLARVYFSMDLISNPLFCFMLIIELATLFIVLVSNLIFFLQSLYLYFTNSQTFLSTFFDTLKKFEKIKKAFLIGYTFSFSVPIKVLTTSNHPLFTVLVTLTNIFFVWVFSLHYFLIIYWIVVFSFLIDAFYLCFIFPNIINIFINKNIDLLFGNDDVFKKEYCNFFFGQNFKKKCFYQILQAIGTFGILYFLSYKESLELIEIEKIILELQDNTLDCQNLFLKDNNYSDVDSYIANRAKYKNELKLNNTTYLKIKILLKEYISNFLNNKIL